MTFTTKLLSSFVFLAASAFTFVNAESHQVLFDNRCGFGTPTLIEGSNVIATGSGAHNFSGPIINAIAYLQTGSCGFNGEGCTLIEFTLENPIPGQPGSGSSVDISLIPPHSFSVALGFRFFNGCENISADCTNANCPTALHSPSDTQVVTFCQANNVSLAITFCD